MIKEFVVQNAVLIMISGLCKPLSVRFSRSIKCVLPLSLIVFLMPGVSVAAENNTRLMEQAESFKSGWKAAQNGELEQAEAIWTTLSQEEISIPELNRALRNNLAVLLIKQEKYQQAENLLNSALKSDNQVATTLANLNQLYSFQAKQTYQKVFSKTPVTLPQGEFLYFDLKTAILPTENVATQLPEFSAEEAYLTQSETQEKIQVTKLLEKWRSAWSGQDIEAYLSFYHAKEFIPKDGMSYPVWVKNRHQVLKRPKFIKVGFDEVQVVQLDKNLIRTRFLQNYESDRFKDSVFKVVLWQLEDDQWKIVQEVTANAKS